MQFGFANYHDHVTPPAKAKAPAKGKSDTKAPVKGKGTTKKGKDDKGKDDKGK